MRDPVGGVSYDDEKAAAPESDPRALRLLVAGAIAAAAAVSLNRLLFAPGGLNVQTDIVGYPTHADFDVGHYGEVFLLVAVFFPAATLVLDAAIGWLGRTRRLRWFDERQLWWAGAIGRVAVPGGVLALEFVIIVRPSQGDALELALAVIVAVSAGAIALAGRTDRQRRTQPAPFECRLAAVGTLLAPLGLLGLYGVSARTEVVITDTGGVDRFPFLPWWAAAAAFILTVLVLVRRVRRAYADADQDRLEDLQRASVAYLSGGLLVFLLSSRIPGALGPMDVFHEGERLAASELLRDGAFPWRDLLFIHGPLADVVRPTVGLVILQDSRWGASAGYSLLWFPLTVVTLWLILARLFKRHWAMLAALAVLVAAGDSIFEGQLFLRLDERFLLLPVCLLVFAWSLPEPRVRRSVLFGVVLAISFLLTPEIAYAVVAFAVVVAAYDYVHRPRRAASRPSWRWFPRTLGAIAGGGLVGAVFAVWLALNGALDDFIFYFRTFAPDHELTGGIPIQWSGLDVLVAAVAPVLLSTIAAVYVVVRRRAGNPLGTEDWLMAVLAILAVLYYRKFLGRADFFHVHPGFALALPLLWWVVHRFVDPVDQWVADGGGRGRRRPRHLVTTVLAALLLWPGVASVADHLANLPSRYQTHVATAATEDRIGFAVDDALPIGLLDDARRVVESLPPGSTVFDFVNQPGLWHYLLDLPSPTRYFHISMAIRAKNQDDLIRELEADPPELVVYWNDRIGLPSWDGVPNVVRHYDVSRWLLDHYQPWVGVHGYAFLLRDDLDLPIPDTTEDSLAPEDLMLSLTACDWGSAPMFLDDDHRAPDTGPELSTTRVDRIASFRGWAEAPGGGSADRVAVVDRSGRVVGESTAGAARPDVAMLEGRDLAASGFDIGVPLAAGEDPDHLTVVAVSNDGRAAPLALGSQTELAERTTLALGSGRTAVLDRAPVRGAVDAIDVAPINAAAGSMARVDLGDGAVDHDWLEVVLPDEPVDASYELSDQPGAGTHAILFETRSGRDPGRYLVQVGACPQWRTWTSGVLYLRSDGREIGLSLR